MALASRRDVMAGWLRSAEGDGPVGVLPRWVGMAASAVRAPIACYALAQNFTAVRLVAAGVLIGLSVAGLWSLPVRRFVGGSMAMLAAIALVGGDSASLALMAMFMLAFEAGYLNARWRSIPVVAIGVTFLVGHAVHDYAYHLPTGWYLSALGLLTVWGAGIVTRREQTHVDALKHAQAELAARAVDAERQRIARDVHDLVAHSLSVTMLHLTAARLALGRDPERARAALLEAERVGRQSMAEIRRTVGLLPPSQDPSVAPVPGAGAICDLVEDFRRAGMAVTVDVTGDPDRVPVPAGLSLYRIVQEALANASRHAPGQPTCVEVTVGAHAVDARIDNAIVGGRATGGGGGHGVAGMAERARLAGGVLRAGPQDGRWSVSVSMPLEPA